MRKLMWVLLGVVLLVGAMTVGTWRHWLEPETKARVAQRYGLPHPPQAQRQPGQQPFSANRSIGGSQGATLPPGAQGRQQPSGPGQQGSTTAGSWQTAEMVINVLNVIVGIIGIWMAFVGMRMQREAMAANGERRRG
jgi:hypothetical protein